MPFPAYAWQQVLHVVARVTHLEAAPDQIGDPFLGPDWCVITMSYCPSPQEAGKLSQFFTRKFRTWAPGLRAAKQSFPSVQAVAAGPSLDRLYAHTQGAGDF